jgi:hypothetical protein
LIIGYASVSTTEQNLGLRHDDLKPAFDASVDQTDPRNARASNIIDHSLRVPRRAILSVADLRYDVSWFMPPILGRPIMAGRWWAAPLWVRKTARLPSNCKCLGPGWSDERSIKELDR